jgi:V/A-type H+/Na+-transporting ATPase subunit E
MADEVSAQVTASNLEALIARLRDEGVTAGRAEAERMVSEAQAQARAIVDKAEADARAKLEAARKEVEGLRRGGEDALRAAARDTVLELKHRLTRRFADDVGKTVSSAMRDEEMLKKMILAIVGRAREEGRVDEAADVELVLPRSAAGLDELRRKPEELREGTLTHYVVATAGEMLRAGVRFSRSEDDAEGLSVRLHDRGVTVDITDEAVAEALLEHLQPRFRALLEGVVK